MGLRSFLLGISLVVVVLAYIMSMYLFRDSRFESLQALNAFLLSPTSSSSLPSHGAFLPPFLRSHACTILAAPTQIIF
jgi:hypothetical protein